MVMLYHLLFTACSYAGKIVRFSLVLLAFFSKQQWGVLAYLLEREEIVLPKSTSSWMNSKKGLRSH